ncbi:MAG: type-F conjugative transfer system pilin assembly protein TrbC [Holosporaceae bacterium]|nr:type-F conjugative transfer system pilin assembly protein TrbC [Holosporaceae bacterium]
MLSLVNFLILFFAFPLPAEDILHDAQSSSVDDVEFVRQTAGRQKLNPEELKFLVDKLPVTGKGCRDCGAQVRNIQNKESNVENGILVFVSFSMPKISLTELSEQSQKYNATLVLRGIYQDSFLKTKDKILEINPNGLRLDINPRLFKEYGIERVPTFVLLRNGREVNRLSGNVTLEFAHSGLWEGQ